MRLDSGGYDPVKAHEYYERTKHLKGRVKSRKPVAASPKSSSRRAPAAPKLKGRELGKDTSAAAAKVTRLKSKVAKLEGALSEARAALSKKRQATAKDEKKNSDGKTTAKERQSAKEYRDKHQAEIAAKRKKDSSKSPSSSSNSVSDMGVEELESRIIKIQGALKEAKRQLSNASQQLGQLAHSELTSEPMFNEHFAQFRSAEGIPSK